MIDIHQAILALNPSVVYIRGDIAYDANEQEVTYDLAAAETKLIEMQAQETAKRELAIAAKESAQAKLAKLGLTEDEIKAMLG